MTAPTFATLLYAVEDGIATITLNRPERMNAFNVEMLEDLLRAFDATDRDDAVRAVIVTGQGERAFCAGYDLEGAGAFARDMEGGKVPRDIAGIVCLRIYESLKPVVGACNGAAVGIGATLQLPMDIRLASADARYGFVFARRGVTMEGASSWFLPRIVGPSTALEWVYSGRVFTAQEALDRGLVRSIHEPQDLLPAAQAILREIIDNTAPVSVALHRQLIYRNMGASHPMEAHRRESRAIFLRGRTADAAEGVGAFLEKRAAVFPETAPADLPDIWDGWDKPEYS